MLWQKQEYNTPHARANIVHADKHQQPPRQPLGQAVSIKQEEQAAGGLQAPQEGLPALVAKLEQNLEGELRHISEQDYVTVAKTLKVVQVAFLTSYVHCMLSLAHYLFFSYQHLGDQLINVLCCCCRRRGLLFLRIQSIVTVWLCSMLSKGKKIKQHNVRKVRVVWF